MRSYHKKYYAFIFLSVLWSAHSLSCSEINFKISLRATSLKLYQTSRKLDESNSEELLKEDKEELSMPLAGGTSLIFEMARKMSIWNENDSSKFSSAQQSPSSPAVLPRWHPHAGISDTNPSFRSSSPKMNSYGYSAAIRRNSRKRNTSLQRYALRVYLDRFQKNSLLPRSSIHFESVLVACSKLGLWETAFNIIQQDLLTENNDSNVKLNDAMVLALIKACVRASRKKRHLETKDLLEINDRRKPLDEATDFILDLTLEKKRLLYPSVTLSAIHILPLASAYLKLGLYDESERLIDTSLEIIQNLATNAKFKYRNREKLRDYLETSIISAKSSSYSLLIKQRVQEEDWGHAIDDLKYVVEEEQLLLTERNLNSIFK